VWVNPSARVLSDGGVSGRQKVWVTKKTPPPVFRATEGDGGRQRVWVNPSAHVLSDGGVSGRQNVWVTKRPLRPRFERRRGLVTGRECERQKKTPPLAFRATEGDKGGWQENPSVSHFERGRGAGVSTERSPPPSHVSSEGGDGGVRRPSTSLKNLHKHDEEGLSQQQ
jgi:hypothetical protein